ncbi:MAG: hypothetical protein R3229_08570 [Alphaproteobacteria bacterium]|nr:hypothetical protein [Alphaproteobacteria bacterium]
MTTSEEMATVAVWMMWGGGIVTVFAIGAAMLSGTAVSRGDLAKPLAIVGACTAFLGAFLYYRWSTPF